MIYLFIFFYLLYLSIYYDILEKKGYKWTHYKIAITLLILIVGLRWRVGADTVLYIPEFYLCPDLFHLEWSNFEYLNRMPLWVVLNATCKTIWNDFLLVQFVITAFNIGVSGYFIKKISPSISFLVLLSYFISVKFFLLHMDLLRESIAVSFYLLGILAINKKYTKLALMYALFAVMFHVFAFIPIFIFIVSYFLLRHNQASRLIICFFFLILVLFNDNFVVNIIEKNIGLIFKINEDVASSIYIYANSDSHGNIDKSILNNLWLIIQFITYVFMLYKYKMIYCKYVLIRKELFDITIFISIVCLCAKYSFQVLYRIGENYNYLFVCILTVVFVKGVMIEKTKVRQKIFMYLMLLIIPLGIRFKTLVYEGKWGTRWYDCRYYPYSSVFDKTIYDEREEMHQLRGGGYSEVYDY